MSYNNACMSLVLVLLDIIRLFVLTLSWPGLGDDVLALVSVLRVVVYGLVLGVAVSLITNQTLMFFALIEQ